MGNRGKGEFIQILRLMEAFPETIVAAAARDAIRIGTIGFDAVKQLVIARVERRPANLNLGDYPYLPVAKGEDDLSFRLYGSRFREHSMTTSASAASPAPAIRLQRHPVEPTS
jgi:hypothetical protein